MRTLISPIIYFLIALSICIFLLFMQRLLAKYNPQSRLYWRRIPIIGSFVFFCTRNPAISCAVYMLKGGVALNPSFKEWWFTVRHYLIFNRIRLIFSQLDDVCDTSLPQTILAMGPAHLGNELCPFLQNVLQKNHIRYFEHLIKPSLLSKRELVAFGNLFAVKLYQQAHLTLEYEKAEVCDKARIRTQIVQENLDIGGICLAFAVHIIKKSAPLDAMLTKNPIMTYEQLKLAYPVPTKVGELLQMLHDISNFRVDLEEEKKIHKICPNYFLNQLEQQHVSSEVIRQLNQLPKRGVGLTELPLDIQIIIIKMQNSFIQRYFMNNPMVNTVLNLSWEYICRSGFTYYTETPLARPLRTTLRWLKNHFDSHVVRHEDRGTRA